MIPSTPRIIASALCLVVAAVLTACGKPPAQAPAAGPSPVSVAVPLEQKVVDWDDFVGRFEAPQTVQVRARVGGYLQSVNFTDGQLVAKGQLLFTLDPRPAQAAVDAAKAALVQAQAQQAKAASELTRTQALFNANATSRSDLETAQAAAATAQGGVQSAQAALDARQLDLEFTKVTAPISGRISDRRVSAGNLVAGGSSAGDVLTSIVSSDPMYFNFDGSEALLLRQQRGAVSGKTAAVKIRLQDETSYNWNGTVDFTDNAIDDGSGVVRLRATLRNPKGFLRPGMFGHAQVVGAAPYTALLIPDAAIVADGVRRIAYVVAKDGTVAGKPLELGPLSGSLRVVRSGLAPDDRVIVDGGQRVQMPGQKVAATLIAIKQDGAKPDNGATITSTPAATATPVN